MNSDLRPLTGFEAPTDVAVFEVSQGPPVSLSTQHVTEGARSLKLATGNYLSTWKLPGNWSGFQSLDLDAYNDTGDVVVVSLLIADQAWKDTGSTYWNRHNGGFNLLPGENHVSIPVEGLYRGEAGSRNNDLKSNIDPGSIVRVDLGFQGKPGAVFLDHLRLVRGTRPATARAFDFGPPDQAVWPGCDPVTWNTLYTRERGFGLTEAQPHANWARDDTFPTRLFSDWVWLEEGAFRVDLPDGRYHVRVVFNDCGYWGGEEAQHTKRSMLANGKEVWSEDRGSRGGGRDGLFRFQDVEPGPGADVAALYYDPLFAPREFDADAVGGHLDLTCRADAPWSAKVAAILLAPADDADASRWIDGVLDDNRREFQTRAAEIPLPAPEGTVAGLPGDARRRGWIVWTPRLDETVWANVMPLPGRAGSPPARAAAPGEPAPFTFAVTALQDLGRARVTVSGLTGSAGTLQASAVTVRAVRHLAKRGFNAIRWRLTPWWLDDADMVDLPANRTRQFWVTVAVPERAPPGRYAGTVHLTSEHGLDESIPLVVEVLPFALDPVDLPVGFYGMRGDWLAFMRGYGLSAVTGGPDVRCDGFDPAGKPRLDFTAVDDYMAAIRAAGYSGTLLSYGGPANLEGVEYETVEATFAEWGKPAGLTAMAAANRVFGAIWVHAREHAWLPFTFAMADEPRVRAQTDRLLASISFLHQAASWLRLSGSYSVERDATDDLRTHALFRALDVSLLNEHDAAILAEGKRLGKTVGIYNQGRDRYTFGAYLWSEHAKGAEAFLQWHMFATHGYQFFDLDGREPDDGVIAVTTRGIRPTLDLERCRLGLTDFRYFATLDRLCQDARRAGRTTQAAAGEAVLASFAGRLHAGERPKPEWLDLESVRARAAAAIMALAR